LLLRARVMVTTMAVMLMVCTNVNSVSFRNMQ
jgi:hypothetical protein